MGHSRNFGVHVHTHLFGVHGGFFGVQKGRPFIYCFVPFFSSFCKHEDWVQLPCTTSWRASSIFKLDEMPRWLYNGLVKSAGTPSKISESCKWNGNFGWWWRQHEPVWEMKDINCSFNMTSSTQHDSPYPGPQSASPSTAHHHHLPSSSPNPAPSHQPVFVICVSSSPWTSLLSLNRFSFDTTCSRSTICSIDDLLLLFSQVEQRNCNKQYKTHGGGARQLTSSSQSNSITGPFPCVRIFSLYLNITHFPYK
jgi:hypothetical protein